MDRQALLDELFATGKMQLSKGRLFQAQPKAFRKPVDIGRIEGMMLGLAIGDSLGNTSESMPPASRRQRFGEIRHFLPNHAVGGKSIGLPSDDTQMAFWTLEQIIEDGVFDPERLAAIFSSRRMFGIGRTVKEFTYNHWSGRPWQDCAPVSAGNGALMRIAPILIPHLRSGDETLWTDAALCARLTHNDSASTASCLAFVRLLWELIDAEVPPTADWWLETFLETLDDLESHSDYTPRFGDFIGWNGSVSAFCRVKVSEAFRNGMSALDACESWGSGAYLLETVPSVIYILMKYGDDPEEAIVRAVNDTRDNDTIAAIVGAAVGALHGASSLPENWRCDLLGRTLFDDDGKVQELIRRIPELI